jgi:serine/threonine-protein kinase HipA
MRRIHQEDFCQALGVPPERKYASEGGPTFRDCFALLRRVSARPAKDIAKLLDAAIFKLIVGNADAHGKNYSILYDDQGPRLAPPYDLLSTVAYPDLSPKMAMRIGKRATLAEMDVDGWKAFARDAAVGMPFIRRRVCEICNAIVRESSNLAGTLAIATSEQAIAEMESLVNDRAKLAVQTIS